jgi:hypothetical protein
MDFSQDSCLSNLCNLYVTYPNDDLSSPVGFHVSNRNIHIEQFADYTDLIYLFLSIYPSNITTSYIILHSICSSGNVRLFDWLSRRIPHLISETLYTNTSLLDIAAKNGHAGVLSRLTREFTLTEECYELLSISACVSDNVALFLYLFKRAGNRAELIKKVRAGGRPAIIESMNRYLSTGASNSD